MFQNRVIRTSAWASAALIALAAAVSCERRERTEPTGEQTREGTREPLPEEKRSETRTEEKQRADKEKADEEKAEREKAEKQVTTVQTTKAVETIVSARCEREARCKNVGAVRAYTSDKACKAELTMKGKDDLKSCETGVRQGELKECVAAISEEDCNNPLDAIERIKECRTSELCG